MTRITLVVLVALGAVWIESTATRAGPPLVCVQIEIGTARSLPWKGGPFGMDPEFRPDSVPTETTRILSEADDAVVHMETLRRAYIYLGLGSDEAGLKTLGGALKDRILQMATVGAPGTTSRPQASRASTLAWFDLAYLMAIIENNGGPTLIPDRTSGKLLDHVAGLAPGSADVQFGVGYALVGNRFLRGEKNLRAAAELAHSESLVTRNLPEPYRKPRLAESRPGRLVPDAEEMSPRRRPFHRTVFIKIDEAKKQFDLGVQFFDARVKADFESGHVKGAVILDPTDEAIVVPRTVPAVVERFDRRQPVIVYDDGGDCDASQLISIQLRKFGFTDVKVFEEGFPTWKAKGYPVEVKQ